MADTLANKFIDKIDEKSIVTIERQLHPLFGYAFTTLTLNYNMAHTKTMMGMYGEKNYSKFIPIVAGTIMLILVLLTIFKEVKNIIN